MARSGQSQRASGGRLTADEHGGRGARREIELEQDVGDVAFDGVIAQSQALRDRRVAQSVGDEIEDFAFAAAEHVEARRLGRARRGFQVLFDHDGEQPHRTLHAFDLPACALDKMQSGARDEVSNNGGDQHLARARQRRDAPGHVQRYSGNLILMNGNLADMHARWPAMVRLAYALTGDQGHAEDVAQAAFARAYASWPKVRRTGNPEAYVRRIVVKQDERTVAEFPLTVGVVGAAMAPYLAAIGALVALLTDCTIEIERAGNEPTTTIEDVPVTPKEDYEVQPNM